jgi:single-strand DNA-binding protein
MAGSLNKVQLIGRLTRDPELRFTPSGAGVCQLGIATNNYRKDPQTGESKETADFHDVVVWNSGNRKLAELCAQYLQKGRLVYVEGRLQTRSWDDKETGAKRYKTEVVANDVQFLDSKGGQSGESSTTSDGSTDNSTAVPAAVGAATTGEGDINPDDIPF